MTFVNPEQFLYKKEHHSKELAKTIPNWLAEVANTHAQAIAIKSLDSRPPLTYQALFEQIQTIAAQLNTLSLKPGDAIAIALDNGPCFLTSILAVASVATAFPINPNQPETEFNRYFSLLDIKAVIVPRDSKSAILETARKFDCTILELSFDSTMAAGQFSLSTIDNRAKPINLAQQQSPQLHDYAVFIGTSGSTGLPKIISLTHESFFVSINHAADWMQLTAADCSLLLMPLAHLHALVRSSCPLLLRGGEVVCTPGYNPEEILGWLDYYRPSFFTGVPSIYRSLLQCIEESAWVPQQKSLRFLVTGSDKIDAAEINAIEAALDVPVIQFYGMSEVSPLPAVRPFPPAATPYGAVGKINPIWQVACIDNNGNHLNPGEEGEIILRGGWINQLIGIANNQTTQNIRNGWFYTGDLGYLDSENFLYYTGRVDNRINRAGKKVYAGDIETVLLTHPAIKQAVVFGIPDALYGESIGAVVILYPDSLVTPESIRQFMTKRVTEFKIPDLILIEDKLPLNQFGKVKRKTLAAHYGLRDLFDNKRTENISKNTNYVAPQTKVEQQLAAIWKDILKLSQVGIDDDFFQLGGHSLLALKLFALIKKRFGRILPINTALQSLDRSDT